jgi:hypothetical protein
VDVRDLVAERDAAAPRPRIEEVEEEGLPAVAQVVERQRPDGHAERGRQPRGVLLSLRLDTRERRSLLLRFDDAHSLAVEEEQVVGITVPRGHRELADRDCAVRSEARG